MKYFDASLYFAHWRYLEVAFRFPKDAVNVKALRRYAGGHTFDVRMMAGDVIVAISVEPMERPSMPLTTAATGCRH